MSVDIFLKPKSVADGISAQDGVDDMTQLSNLDVDGINTNLQVRFNQNKIYTYTGSILVAVNPYKQLGVYETDTMDKYKKQKLHDQPPHVFAIADVAYRRLMSGQGNQSCVISGESGAGKTETTKYILQYLCTITSTSTTFVEQQIIETNIILEAFGNARTVRNDNSSRFGKFMQICFDEEFEIRGSIIQEYLLEQSRITFQAAQERNYHVFYQLLKGADKEKYILEDMKSYKFVNQSGCYELSDVDDKAAFEDLCRAMTVLQIEERVMEGIFSVVSAVLHIGNLQFVDRDEFVNLTDADKEICQKVGKLMELPASDIEECVLTRQIIVRGEVTTIQFNMVDALENRNAMAKALYSRTFTWLVAQINSTTNPGDFTKYFIGVLDIFGFENFTVNSFEQLCINFTNEKLHKFFNHYVFDLEQAEYEKEGISFQHIEFTDNTECLDLIEKAPKCILRILDEECRFPKGTDATYLQKQDNALAGLPRYLKGDDKAQWKLEFGVEHFAGAVTYSVEGFLAKNKDVMQDLLFEKMRHSTSQFVNDVTRFQNLLQLERNMLMGKKAKKRGSLARVDSMRTNKAKPTVGDTFRQQLAALVDVLESTTPWYVRCIKPNSNKAALEYDPELVRAQLLYSGMLDIVRIRREGYPIHIPTDRFVSSYQALARVLKMPLDKDIKAAAKQILEYVQAPENEWQIGHTKVFLRESVFDPLQEKLQEILLERVVLLQSHIRRWRAQREYKRTLNAIIKIQAAVRGAAMRWKYLRRRRAAVTIQAYTRGWFARELVKEVKKKKQEEIERRKRDEERRRFEEMQRQGEAQMEQTVEEGQRQLYAMAKMAELQAQNVGKSVSASDVDGLFGFLSKVNVTNEDEKYRKQIDQDLDAMFGKSTKPEGTRTLRRKKRVQKQLAKQPSLTQPADDSKVYLMIEYAKRHFNDHHSRKGTLSRSMRRQPTDEPAIPKEEMIKHTVQPTIPLALVHMHNPENNALACSMWKDLNKQFRGELKPELVLQSTQSILSYCLERPELRDEVYCQAIRQATENPNPDELVRVWQFLCIMCVTFPPGKLLYKYALSYFKVASTSAKIPRVKDSAMWCHDAVRVVKLNGPRRLPPSATELDSIRGLSLVPIQIYFLGSRPRAIGVHPCSTAMDLVHRVGQKLKLQDVEGFALYETTPQSERSVRGQEYVGDILSKWETEKRTSLNPTEYKTLSRKSSNSNIKQAIGGGDARIVFKKRLFKTPREVSRDPVEHSLVYGQAVHSVVHADHFALNEQAALNLAGLQAQVLYGNYDAVKTERYIKIEAFIPWRLRNSKKLSREQWAEAIAKAHEQFGSGKSELQAKVLYLTAVKRFPLYGGTFFDVQHKDFWSLPTRVFLTIHVDGFKFVHTATKKPLAEFSYNQLSSVEVNIYEDTITLHLKNIDEGTKPSIMFYTPQKEDIANLIASYSPKHRNWTQVGVANVSARKATKEDKARTDHEVDLARKRLVESGLLMKPSESSRGSFLSTTLRRKKSQQKVDEKESVMKLFPSRYWSYSKSKLQQPLTKVQQDSVEVALRLYTSLLVYAKLTSSGGYEVDHDRDNYQLVQNVIGKCLEKEDICNEFYLQLIKQTTDQPDPNSSINVRNWGMLALTIGVVVPRNKDILNYLTVHLRRCALDSLSEEGKFAQYCQGVLGRTIANQNRKYPPSTQEIQCVIKRRPIYARFYFMDGEYRALVFDPAATTTEVVSLIRDRLALGPSSQGFTLFEVFGNVERTMMPYEKVADAMFKWEKYAAARNVSNDLKLTFKKRLFLKPFTVPPNNNIEFDLVLHQAIHDVKHDKFPVTNEEAAYLTALRSQVELGNLEDDITDFETLYGPLMDTYLPKHLKDVIEAEDIAAHHKKLRDLSKEECNTRYIKLVQSWPLYGSTVFEVMQSYTTSIPKLLWLAVNQDGVHIMKRRAKEPLISTQYNHIVNYSPSLKNLVIVTESLTSGTKYVFNTVQGSQIAHLIRDYTHVIIQRRQRAKQQQQQKRK